MDRVLATSFLCLIDWRYFLTGVLSVLGFKEEGKIERFFSQPFHVAEVFTGSPGILVDISDTIKGFKGLCNGDYDHLPEAAFYMVGTIEDAIKKGEELAKEE